MKKSKKQLINDAIRKMIGDRPQHLYFITEKGEEIVVDYSYNEKTDDFETKYGSVSMSDCKKESINCESVDKHLCDLEDLIIEVLTKEKGVRVGTYDD